MKLACEEAADMIGRIWSKESSLIKPLRSEARELKRLRRIVSTLNRFPPQLYHMPDDTWESIKREAARIQKAKKARKAK